MCGIAGIVGMEHDYAAEAAEVHQMCQSMVHRGPDDEGIYACGRAALGMRRLSIIDLSKGHQPIHNETGDVWVVFNGEIYNFPELRQKLEMRGHRFYTNSDTEVIVHLYEEHGVDSVKQLRGMFALAIWDQRREKLLLARDRFGKKPLHYGMDGTRLLFGSEIKAILAAAPDLADIAPNGLLNFFYFGYIPDPDTAFKHIRKLPPGHLLEFSDGRTRVRKYWDLPSYGTYEPPSEQEGLEELERRLTEAVRIRLISDVPLGALLSGGVDSSIVVALMARFSSRPVKTFSIGFPNRDFNETDHARSVAKQFGTEHYELYVEPDIEQTVERLTGTLEEPFGDSSIVPTYHVCRMARQHVTVALAGDGGDELFAGYERYATYLGRRRIQLFPFGTGQWYRRLVHPRIPAGWRGRRFLYNLSLPLRERYLDGISALPTGHREKSIFSKDFLAWAQTQPSPYDSFLHLLERRPTSDPLSEVQYLDAKTYLPGDILAKVDRMSMANSLEVRAPFLDHPLAEWAAELSPSWKLRQGERKYLLKKLAERLKIPNQVVYRPKQGFAMPLRHWFRENPAPALLHLLLEPRTMQRGYFEECGVRQLLKEHRKGIRDRSWELWQLLIFELWHRNFVEPKSAPKQAVEFAPLFSFHEASPSPGAQELAGA